MREISLQLLQSLTGDDTWELGNAIPASWHSSLLKTPSSERTWAPLDIIACYQRLSTLELIAELQKPEKAFSHELLESITCVSWDGKGQPPVAWGQPITDAVTVTPYEIVAGYFKISEAELQAQLKGKQPEPEPPAQKSEPEPPVQKDYHLREYSRIPAKIKPQLVAQISRFLYLERDRSNGVSREEVDNNIAEVLGIKLSRNQTLRILNQLGTEDKVLSVGFTKAKRFAWVADFDPDNPPRSVEPIPSPSSITKELVKPNKPDNTTVKSDKTEDDPKTPSSPPVKVSAKSQVYTESTLANYAATLLADPVAEAPAKARLGVKHTPYRLGSSFTRTWDYGKKTKVVFNVRQADHQRILKDHFRNAAKAGCFLRWADVENMLDDPTIKRRLISYFKSNNALKKGKHRFAINLGYMVGWAGTLPKRHFSENQLKSYKVNNQCSGEMVADANIPAALTSQITFSVEIANSRKYKNSYAVYIKSVYPGPDIGNLNVPPWNISDRGWVFLDWDCDGEALSCPYWGSDAFLLKTKPKPIIVKTVSVTKEHLFKQTNKRVAFIGNMITKRILAGQCEDLERIFNCKFIDTEKKEAWELGGKFDLIIVFDGFASHGVTDRLKQYRKNGILTLLGGKTLQEAVTRAQRKKKYDWFVDAASSLVNLKESLHAKN